MLALRLPICCSLRTECLQASIVNGTFITVIVALELISVVPVTATTSMLITGWSSRVVVVRLRARDCSYTSSVLDHFLGACLGILKELAHSLLHRLLGATSLACGARLQLAVLPQAGNGCERGVV